MESIKDDTPEENDDSKDESEEEEEDLDEGDEDQVEQDAELKQDDSEGDPTGDPLDEAEGSPKEKEKAEDEYSPDVDGLSPSLLARELSRSPPQSRSPSPSSLAKMTASLSLSTSQHADIKDIVSSDLTKQRARQREKYHSKRGAHRIGRPKGSKAKQDNRVKVDKSGVWE